MSVDFMYVLVEMWPPSRSVVTSNKLMEVVKILSEIDAVLHVHVADNPE